MTFLLGRWLMGRWMFRDHGDLGKEIVMLLRRDGIWRDGPGES
jgi:hypothetical protein